MKKLLLIAFAVITGFTQAQVKKKTSTTQKPKTEKKWVNPVQLTKEERNRPYMDEVLKTRDSITPEEAERRRKNIAIGNPFAKYGYYPKIATLSKGKYLEFHDTDSIVVIGSIRYNTKSGSIIEVREIDLSDPDAQPIGDTHGRWISPDPLSEEFSNWSPYNYAFQNPIRNTDPTGLAPEDIVVPQKYQAQFNKTLSSVFGKEASNFSYDSNGKLSYTGDTKNFNSDQKAIYKGLDNLMSSKDVTNVIYEKNYSIVDNNGNSIPIDASKSGGESTILKAENSNLSENYVIVDPNGAASVNVMEVTSNYYSSKGTMPSPNDPTNFKPATVQTNPENSTIHGLGHVVNAGKSQDKVLNYDNKARTQMNMPKRNPDETHNKTVTTGSGSVWEQH